MFKRRTPQRVRDFPSFGRRIPALNWLKLKHDRSSKAEAPKAPETAPQKIQQIINN